MKPLTLTASAILGVCLLGAMSPAHAQFGDLKKIAKKRLEKEAVKEIEKQLQAPAATTPAETSTATSGNQAVQSAEAAPALGKPAANLRAITQCSSLRPSNILIGKYGDYTFQQGMSSERRTGLIGRRSAELSDGCILPSMQPREVVYMEVPTAELKTMGGSSEWEMQCVKSANPSAGAVGQTEGLSEYPHKVNYLAGKDIMLHCGNSENVSECATGSNSNRSGEWKKKLDSRGMTMLSVLATPSTLAPANGEKLYCQYYNKPSGKSLFAFEYLRTPG